MGYNAGTIRSSGVSSPGIAATATYATVRAGGFVGANRGQIRQSYAFGVIQIPQIRDSKVALAGFAAENRAGIRNSYCAMALSSMNADTYGFAPESGSISGCYYLSGGTYAYCGEVYLYDNTTGTAGASPVTKPQLEQLAISGFGRVDAQHTLHHPNTEKGVDGVVFPYPAVVSAADGRTVYYGDWPTDVNMGKIGVVYWEHEEGGSNAGYRISFLGYNGSDRVSGSNLCTEHDDGGAVREYGYGYYWLNGEDTPSEPTATVDGGNFVLGNVNQTASDRLAAQIVDYHFVLYQTGVNGMRLETYKAANGAWALTQNGKTYHFSVCPFFANAFNYMDGTTGTDAPGTANRAYAVRSVEQLQFINWSYVGSKGSADEDVTGSNVRYVPLSAIQDHRHGRHQ